MIVDCAVYGDGRRPDRPRQITGVRAEAADARGFAWVGLVETTLEEFDAVRREFALHELAVEDAVRAHQRPKLEIYGDTLFLVLKTVRYLGHEEVVDIGEVMIFVGPARRCTPSSTGSWMLTNRSPSRCARTSRRSRRTSSPRTARTRSSASTSSGASCSSSAGPSRPCASRCAS